MRINWKKEIFTIPNLLSLIRLILIPVYVVIYLNEHYLLAGVIIAVSCMTDAVDGFVARHFNMISHVGKLLDPLADKLTQFALILCLTIRYPAMLIVLVLLVVKEIIQAICLLLVVRKGKALKGALIMGKICTAFLFTSLVAMVVFPNLDEVILCQSASCSFNLIQLFAIVDSILLVAALVQYLFAFFGKHSKVIDLKDDFPEE